MRVVGREWQTGGMRLGGYSSELQVYGDVARFRRRLKDLIAQGDQLLSEVASYESRSDPHQPTEGLSARLECGLFDAQVGSRIYNWKVRIYRELTKSLGKTAPEWHRLDPRTQSNEGDLSVTLDRARITIREQQLTLEDLASRVPGRRLSPPANSAPDLEALRESRIVDERNVDWFAKRMSRFKTVQQCSEAIGASKELVEATYVGVLALLGEPDPGKGDFPALGKKVRTALESRSGFGPTAEGSRTLAKLLSGMGMVNQALGELRNELGTGHGRPRQADGLAVRHARFAVDLAAAECRYLALTMQDINVLKGG